MFKRIRLAAVFALILMSLIASAVLASNVIVESKDFSCSEQWVDGQMVSTNCQQPDLSYWSNCAAGGGWMGEPEDSEFRWMVTCVRYGEDTTTPPDEKETTGTLTNSTNHPFPTQSQKAENTIIDITNFHASETQWIEEWSGGNGIGGTQVLVVIQDGGKGDWWYFPVKGTKPTAEHYFYRHPNDKELQTR